MPQDPTPITFAFLDLETTGLDPQQDEIWEIGLTIDRVPDLTCGVGRHAREVVLADRTYYLRPEHLGTATPKALEISRYYDRHPDFRSIPCAVGDRREGVHDAKALAASLAPLLQGVHLVGCTIHFDAAFLETFLRSHGQVPMWNYHLIDATVYAAGRLGLKPPWKSKTVTDAYSSLGLKGLSEDDAKQARDLFYAALELGPAPA